MTVYYCPVPYDEYKNGNAGLAYAADHRDDWVDGTNLLPYLSTGWVKGCDYWYNNGKVYMIMTSYQNTEKDYVVHICVEDVQARRNSLTAAQIAKL